jgi:hypothetical protein
MTLHFPMRLLCILEPFDYPDLVFEPKIDVFGALAYGCGVIPRQRVGTS